jgi:hypothetical protein
MEPGLEIMPTSGKGTEMECRVFTCLELRAPYGSQRTCRSAVIAEHAIDQMHECMRLSSAGVQCKSLIRRHCGFGGCNTNHSPGPVKMGFQQADRYRLRQSEGPKTRKAPCSGPGPVLWSQIWGKRLHLNQGR